ncbi:MAG: ferritin-like domain-containing protein [Ktedonobacteraceae bacterium]
MKRDENISKEEAYAKLQASFNTPRSRRALLKGAAAATGVVAGAGMLAALPASAMVRSNGWAGAQNAQAANMSLLSSSQATTDSIVTILTVARTAEQLAVTFYTNGINNASQLGISGSNLDYLKAALIEEQIHQQFFAANGGQSLATTFSFPNGAKTFTDLNTFIATQQQLEGVFDSAFLAAIFEFAQLGRPDLAQIAGQIATVESEHRALGRVIGNLTPADNWAFTPVLIATVGDAPALVTKAGYLSPTSGNSYTYQQVSTNDTSILYQKPFSVGSTMVGNG